MSFDVSDRKEMARILLAAGADPVDVAVEQIDPDLLAQAATLTVDLALPFPEGLSPIPQPLPDWPDREAPLSGPCDVLVITWTIAELDALADVLTPGFSRRRWYFYRHRFDDHYDALIRNGAPAKNNRRLGSWFRTKVGDQHVVCFKSELHLNQDGISLNEDGTPANSQTGFATLPVKDLFHQLIAELNPAVIITTGTAGATFVEHDLGDVVVTRGAKFRLSDEFRKEPYNGIHLPSAQYTSQWDIPTAQFDTAVELMQRHAERLVEPDFAPPTKRFGLEGPPLEAQANNPNIQLDGREMPEFHPILSTDFFEFGTSDNGLEERGCAVEMGDAVLGLAAEEIEQEGGTAPHWVVVRNVSDPQINADLPTEPRHLNMQTHWAVWYYEKYGYWTSVSSALACWAIIAGL